MENQVQAGNLIAERFLLLRPLGAGGGGAVWLATDQVLLAPVALKILALANSDAGQQQAFDQECQLLTRLQHPHIVRLLGFGGFREHRYAAFEWVEGEDLVTAAKALHWDAVFQLIVQAAWALDYLHRQGLLHRDLKPQNILVGKVHAPAKRDEKNRLNLKIIDFGLAVEREAMTEKSGPAGTLRYIAPEILQHRPWTPRADLFSFGVVLYELCLGKLPKLSARNFSDFLQQLEQGRVDLDPLEKSETPKGLMAVIRALLKVKPEERLGSAGEIVALLNQVEGERFPLEVPRTFEPIDLQVVAPMEVSTKDPLTALRLLTRAGRRTEAWAYAEPLLKKPGTYGRRAEWAEFMASALHLLIDQGRYAEVEHYLPQFPPGNLRTLTEMFYALRKGDLEAVAKAEAFLRKHLNALSVEERARFESYRAFFAQARHDLEQARRHLTVAVEWAGRSGRKDHQASLMLNAGSLALAEGLWAEAFEQFQAALQLNRDLDHRSNLATTLNNLGNLYLYFGRFADAEAALKESLFLAEEQDLKQLIAYNLYLLTVAEEGKGNWERVAEGLDKALAFANELGDSQPILQALLAQGYFFLAQQHLPKAQAVLHDLRARAAQAKAKDYLLQADWLQAKLELQGGQKPSGKVLEILQRVEQDARERKNSTALWQIAADEGDYFRALGKNQAAERAFGRSLALMQERLRYIPEKFHDSYFRDRKKERVRAALASLYPKTSLDVPSPAPQWAMEGVSFQKWVATNRRILRQDRLKPLLEEILDAALDLTDAERGFVIHSEAGEFLVQAARNLDQEGLEREEEKFSKTIAEEVLRKGEAQIITDAVRDPRFSLAQSVHAMQLRSVLCVPLQAGVKTVGLIYLDNRIREGVFRTQHLPMLQALADQASLALEHARLHQANLEKIAELKRRQELIEKLNSQLEQRLEETAADLNAAKENLRRQNQEIALKYTYDRIIGESAPLKKLLKHLDRVVETGMNLFICGESGTGKELVAQAVHYNGPRRSYPFIAVNCSAIPENLLESELFGHVKGAFTGAEQNKTGLFTLAHRGTLFLDEVGDMPLAMQAKLLRVLQEGELRPLGGEAMQKVDVRVVSASNKDLSQLVQEGKFRQDLYYRLNVARIDLPSLRERREDIPLLVENFLKVECEKVGRPIPKITRAALKVLLNYRWPGNIRELQNEILHCLALTEGNEINPEILSPHLLDGPGEPGDGDPLHLEKWVRPLEKRLIAKALEKARGNKVKAAKLLKIGRRTLYAKMELYGL